jgi:hypothetical protein
MNGPPNGESAPDTIALALLSHTNVGKTTLARTLLRQDIGAVADRAHVTDVAEAYPLLRSAAGDELLLWDTPGFGDSVRLLRRLERSGTPLGWFLTQVWDRYADRPFWCSQQALRAARDAADVVLYVVNATEPPEAAGYAGPELRIVGWLGKPVLVLLNQLGPAADRAREAAIAQLWEAAVAEHAPGQGGVVLSFDAFARCWLQEHVLLAAIGNCLPEPRRLPYRRLRDAWRERDRDVLARSAAAIAAQLAGAAADVERLPEPKLGDKLLRTARQWSRQGAGADPEEQRAQKALLARLDGGVRECTAALVQLHGLVGGADADLLRVLGSEFRRQQGPDPDRAGIVGGLVSGALGGLAADLAAGGLTLGGGALLGAITGALGARALTQRYNAERGLDAGTLRWSDEFLEERLESALVRYLAVAHFGRGRGEFRSGEPPVHWLEAVRDVLAPGRGARQAVWEQARTSGATAGLEAQVADALRDLLARLYPDAAAAFEES